MKVRRFISVIMTICMLIALVPSNVAFAADMQQWDYYLEIQISNASDSKSKNGNIQAKIMFDDNNEETFTVSDTKKTGVLSKTTYTSSRAPWQVNHLMIKNNSKDAFKILWVKLSVAAKGKNNYKTLIDKQYPSGTGNKDGLWIERDTKGRSDYWMPNTGIYDRDFSSYGNYDSKFSETLYIAPSGNSGKVSYQWDGKVSDQYTTIINGGSSYDCRNMSGTPTFSYTASGTGIKATASKDSLTKAGVITDVDYGFSIDKAKLQDYMNKYNMNQIKITSVLQFPTDYSNWKKTYKRTKTMTIIRTTFAVDDGLTWSDNYYTPMTSNQNYNKNNLFYNNEKLLSEKRAINVTAQIKTGGNNNHLTQNYVNGQTLSYDKATLTLGGSGKTLTLSKGSVKVSGTKITLQFPYSSGDDSQNDGLTLTLTNPQLSTSKYSSKLVAWDEATKKVSFTKSSSIHKIDASNPTVTLATKNSGDSVANYHKTITLTSSASEDISVANGKTLNENEYSMELLNSNGNPVKIYDYKGKSSAALTQLVPAAGGAKTEITLALADSIEGVYTLKLTGQDKAGNSLNQTLSNIHLDNKAPEVSFKEVCGALKADGTKTNDYVASISDASGTGKIYYCFTTDTLTMPEFNADNATAQTSGTIDSTLNRWAFINQSDTEGGKTAAAHIKVEEGEIFKGKLVYFGIDDFGNKTKTNTVNIEIINESTKCSIDTESSTAVPQSSYQIQLTTKGVGNTLYYRWQDSKGKYVTSYAKCNGTSIDTSTDNAMQNADGEYILKVKVVPPSGEKNAEVVDRSFVFDNSAPTITASPTDTSTYSSYQTVSVRVNDAAGVQEGYAQIVKPDGSKIDGYDEFELNVSADTIAENVTIKDIPSGAYALAVRAKDIHGLENKVLSKTFCIRNDVPNTTSDVVTSLSYMEKPLIASEQYSITLNVTEDFANASKCDSSVINQSLYYRVSTSVDTFGEWIKATDSVNVSGDTLVASATVNSPIPALSDGENLFYIQTALYTSNGDTSKINLNTINTTELSFYYDSIAPSARLVIEDVHTNASVEGKVYLTDNFDTEISLASSTQSIVVEKVEGEINEYKVTVNDNVNATLTATDGAGNKTSVPIKITGIDTEPPTSSIVKTTYSSGDREDSKATVTINDAANVSIAVIPKSQYTGGNTIDDSYFVYNDEIIKVKQTSMIDSEWGGESIFKYEVKLAGEENGEYYVAVRAADSLGNSVDKIFTGADELMTCTDPGLAMESKITPKKAGEKAIVRLSFNEPVYVLPQDKITSVADPDLEDEKSPDDTNLEIARQMASAYSLQSSFIISAIGDYKIYTVDDLGRGKIFTLNVTANDVEFGAAGGINTTTRDPYGNIVESGEMTTYEGVWDSEAYLTKYSTVVVEPTESGMLLSPYEEDVNNGLTLNEEQSQKSESYPDFYTKIVYDAMYMYDTDDNGYTVDVLTNEREVYAYIVATDSIDDSDMWSLAMAVVDNIDNTPPTATYQFTPEIIKYKDIDDDPIEYGVAPLTTPGSDYRYERVYTPSNVEITVDMQDIDSGIEKIDMGSVKYIETVDGIEDYKSLDIPEIPMKDEDGNYIDYVANPWTWSADGAPVTISFYGDEDAKGLKTLCFTFTDNADVNGIYCYNAAGERTYIAPLYLEGVTTVDCIYKIPIEENYDYYLTYYYEDSNGEWQEMTDNTAYYNRVKAVIEPGWRAETEERELKVTNNGGSFERILDIYETSYTFTLRDKYGYTAEVPVSYELFDIESGTIEYQLSNTSKTNSNITLDIYAEDEDSGVGVVKVIGSDGELNVTDKGSGYYSSTISKNGPYSIVMYDKVGNKAVENFSVSNINKDTPTVSSISYSVDQNTITSKSVSATVYFDKPNVRIAAVEAMEGGTLTDSDFSIDYSNSVITFLDSGTVTIYFEDDYGNGGADTVTVNNIDRTPPSLSAVASVNSEKTEVTIGFEKAKNEQGVEIDKRRSLSDITVFYGGIAKKVETVDENDKVTETAQYVFHENGTYTFKVYDDEGLSSYLTVNITQIDTEAPVITEIRWSYGYDLLENGEWQKKTSNGSWTVGNEAGYVVASDQNPVTNQNVTVTVVTDSETRIEGITDEYTTENEREYTDNGMYIFSMQKANTLTDLYGVDIEVIDKTPPVLDLLDKQELIFYENENMGESYSKDYLSKLGEAFNAYDVFANKTTNLNDRVKINYGSFDADNIKNNTFDSSIPYTITYEVSDDAHNTTVAKRTVRLIGMYDTVALVNGNLPDYAGRSEVEGDSIKISLKNISDTATVYARYEKGVKTMGEMKKQGTMLTKNSKGEFVASGLERGWYTFFVQTDKRDYFNLQVYLYN